MNLAKKPREIPDGIVILGLLLMSTVMTILMIVGLIQTWRWVWNIFTGY